MTGVSPLRREQRVFRQRNAQMRNACAVDSHQFRVLFRIARGKRARNGRIVGKAEVDKPLSPVAQQRFQMIGSGVALRFAVLRHNIADVELLRVRSADRIGHSVDQKVGDHARI